MEHPDTAQLAAVGGALGAILVLLARGRVSLLAGLALLVAAEVGLTLGIGDGGLDRLTSAAGLAAALVGLAVLGGAAALLARRPGLAPVAILAAAPFRPPLDFSTSNDFLVAVAEDGRLGRLLPLYFVLTAAVLALGWRALKSTPVRGLPRPVALPAAAFFAFAACSLLWADDLEAGANLLLFFTLPFAALIAVVARADYPEWVPRALGIVAVGLASAFAALGLWQAATHDLLFFAPNLAVSNANTDYFRVTSFFGDPSLYGRHVVLGLGVVLALLAARRSNRWLLVGALTLMWAGLLFSYSQSSMVALVVITLAIAAATGGAQVRRAVVLLAAVGLVAVAGYVGVRVAAGDTVNQITSDRTDRVEYALDVVREHPVIGVGIGGQPRASREIEESDRPTPNFVSHTTPLTVAAELGVIGLGLYAWLLAGGAWLLSRVYRLDDALGLALGAAFLGLFVHALFYSGFLEDPLTWVVLGVGAGWLAWGEAHLSAEERVRRREAKRGGAVAT